MGVSVNPFWDDPTVLLLHFDGADASTSFTDSAVSPNVITANGDAQIDTAQSKFGGSSLLLDGAGDYLTAPASSDWELWVTSLSVGRDSTIDVWVRFNNLPTAGNLMTFASKLLLIGGIFETGWRFEIKNNAGTYQLALNTYTSSIGTGNFHADVTVSTGTWYHVAVERYVDDVNFYLNGTKQTTVIDTAWNTSEQAIDTLYIGKSATGTSYLDGWMDEFRISKGIARYQGTSFTPNTSAYPDPDGT